MARELVFFVLRKELLNFSETAPRSTIFQVPYTKETFGGKMAP